MTMRAALRGLTAAALLAGACPSMGQEILRNILDGTTPPAVAPAGGSGSWVLSEMESLNPYSGSLSFNIPLAKAGGRGETSHGVVLPIESRWIVDRAESNGAPVIAYPTEVGRRGADSAYGFPIMERRDSLQETWCGGDVMQEFTLTRLHWMLPGGGHIELVDAGTDGTAQLSGLSCVQNQATGVLQHYDRGTTFVSKDGSGHTFVSDVSIKDYDVAATINGILYTRAGLRYRIESGRPRWISDRNGNLVTILYETDTQPADPWERPVAVEDALGRRITLDYGRDGHHPNEDWISYGGVQGARTIIIRYSPLSAMLYPVSQIIKKVKELFPQASYPAPYVNVNDYDHNPNLPSEVELPDGRKFLFKYNSYGELSRVTLPTGGVVEYDWTGYTSDGTGYYGDFLIYRRVSERRVFDAGGTTLLSRTQYSVPLLTQMPPNLVVTTAELGGAEPSAPVLRSGEHQYAGNPFSAAIFPPLGYPGWREGRELQVATREGVTTVEMTVNTWGQRDANNQTIIPASEAAMPNDPRITKKARTLGGVTSQTTYEYSVDTHNNVTKVCDTDFGTQAATRCREFSYVTSASYTSPPVHLRGLAQTETVRQMLPSPVVESTASYEYDNYGAGLTTYPTIAQHDPARGASYLTRGNVTRETRGAAVTSASYDVTGNAVSVTTPAVETPAGPQTATTTFSFADQFDNGVTGKNTYAFATVITDGENLVQRRYYHWPAGVLLRWRDANLQDTTYGYNDPLDRPTLVQPPIGRTDYIYDDANRKITTTRRLSATQSVTAAIEFDGLGRTVRTRQSEGATEIVTETGYDLLGRVQRRSNPGRGAASQWTTLEYDALDRAVKSTHPDNTVERTCYTNNETIQVDAALKWRKTIADGMGRLVAVVEDVSGSCQGQTNAGADIQTTYTYNARDLLRFVNHQGGQAREFRYDDHGRLTKSIQPESGTTDYGYDAAGNLVSRVSNGNTATLRWDKLNRVRTKSYSGPNTTPAVTYCYDGNTSAAGCAAAPSGSGLAGRLTMAANSEATVKYSGFDALGRVTAHQVMIAGQGSPFNFSYEYNDLALTAAVYPSGRRVTNGFDGAGRINAVSGLKDAVTTQYVTGMTYAPHGSPDTITVGGARTEQWCYNNRMQPVAIRFGLAAVAGCLLQAGDLLHLSYGYGVTDNNGNVRSQAITRGAFAATQTYGYDPLNRINSITEGAEYRNYQSSAVGNMWVTTASANLSPGSFTPRSEAWFDANNRMVGGAGSGIQFDAAGNMKQIGGYGFEYDAEGRMVKSTLNSVETRYAYDGEGRRVKKGSLVLVYDAFGRLAAEYGGTVGTGGTEYLTGDHLGSTRLVTDAGPWTPRICIDYLPYGELIGAGANGRPACHAAAEEPRQKFTGKERDSETGLDYFGARYFSGAQGRFTSPDPFLPMIEFQPESDNEEDVEEAGQAFNAYIGNPQHWNRYAYALNNPLAFKDEDGRIPIPVIIAAVGAAAASPAGQRAMIAGSTYLQRYAPQLQRIALTSGQAISNAVFTLGPALRGRAVEALSGAPRAFANFPGLDKPLSAQGVATSIKSVDVFAKSYQSGNALFNRLAGYVDQLAGARGGLVGNAAVDPRAITKRVLEVVVPKGGIQAAQQTFQRVIQYARKYKDLEIVFKETQ